MIPFYIVLSAILGLIVGSFLSMLIPRLHNNETGIVFGRSYCPSCRKKLTSLDLIPLLSFLFLRGKCRSCKKKISLWYPLTELGTALLFVLLFLYTKDIKTFLLFMPSFAVLGFIFFYDLRYKEIHDAVMIPGILFTLIVSLYLGNGTTGLIGALIAGSFFGLQYLVSKGTWLGSGDIRIGIFMGLLLGIQNTLIAIMLSYIAGSFVAIFLLASKKATAKTAVPLGPFLVTGTVLAFLFGNNILETYFLL